MTAPTAFEQRAWSWVSHLREGGTTPWCHWRTPDDGQVYSAPGVPLPGAAQLELVRRLAELSPGAGFAQLADVVYGMSGPGRGLPELPLVGAPVDEASGPRPVDPADVPPSELVRVAAGVLVSLMLGMREPHHEPTPPRRLMPWAKAVRVTGAPLTSSGLRRQLRSQGYDVRGRRPLVVVVGLPFDLMMAEVWARRVLLGSDVRWSRFWARWHQAPHLPGFADLGQLANRWADQVGPHRVHVVLARDHAQAAALTGSLVGADLVVPDPAFPAEAVDLVRAVNKVLNVAVTQERHDELLREVVRPLVATPGSPRLAPPPRLLGWAAATARESVRRLREAGYPVLGDPEAHVPRGSDPEQPDVTATLDVALHACLRAAGREEKA